MKSYPVFSNFCSLILGASIVFFVMTRLSKSYVDGYNDTMKSAYDEGLAVKTTLNGETIYRWKELHKIGYENDN